MSQETYSFYVIDDDAIFTFTHKKIIELFFKRNTMGSCQIQSFEHPLDALSFFEALLLSEPQIEATRMHRDIVLVDINMPCLNGFEFSEKIHQLVSSSQAGFAPDSNGLTSREFETYILSSSISSLDRHRAQALDFIKGYVEKPLSDAKLTRLLRAESSNIDTCMPTDSGLIV